MDVKQVRKNFPVLSGSVHGKPLVYLDNAATTQKPRQVIDAVNEFYSKDYATVHRGIYLMSQEATARCDEIRDKVAKLINAFKSEEIIFTKGATEALNLFASSYGRKNLTKENNVVVSQIEHHSNIVPWQMLQEEIGFELRVIPVNDDGELIMDEYKKLLDDKTAIVSVNQISNALGTINPVKEIIDLAHEKGAKVMIDGAQAVPHIKVDVQALDADFYCFSAHKMYGPTGIGVLYGKYALLEQMTPYQGGGDMIDTVSFKGTTFAKPPLKFEAGTPAIAQTIGFGAAIDYVNSIGYDAIASQEQELLDYATSKMQEIQGLKIIGTAKEKAAVISFVIDDIHPHDIGTILDSQGIAIRVGHHCAQPAMERFGITATARASFSFYNTKEEVDALVAGLQKVLDVFSA